MNTILSYLGIIVLCAALFLGTEYRKTMKFFRKTYGTRTFKEGMQKYRESLAEARAQAAAIQETENQTGENQTAGK